jgi:N-acyl-D-amino-acid deacylase
VGCHADMVLFNPSTVGISNVQRQKDLPGGGARMIRKPAGLHGVWVNGAQVHDGKDYVMQENGPGQVLKEFLT